MSKFKVLPFLFGALLLAGAGCQGAVKEIYSIVDKDPVAAVNASGYYDEVQSVGGVKTLVRPSDIRPSGQGMEGIPVLTTPSFVSVEEAQAEGVLFDDLYGISVADASGRKFYSLQILAWHEIVHDTIDGQPIIVAYSPLTEVAGVYRSSEGGFGISGYVWNNESLIYDGESETLWSKLIGRGVYGPAAGADLSLVPFELVSWGKWRAAYPDGQVLTTQTGYTRRYDRSPYGTYSTTRTVLFPVVQPFVPALEPKAIVSGVVIDGIAKAYQEGPIVDELNGLKLDVLGETNVVVWVDEVRGALQAHRAEDVEFRLVDGDTLKDRRGNTWTLDAQGNLVSNDRMLGSLVPQTMYWFAWSSLYPQSHLYANVIGKGLVDGPVELEKGDGIDLEKDGTEIKIDSTFGTGAVEGETV